MLSARGVVSRAWQPPRDRERRLENSKNFFGFAGCHLAAWQTESHDPSHQVCSESWPHDAQTILSGSGIAHPLTVVRLN